jgi:phosphoribosylamine--glycine ligase
LVKALVVGSGAREHIIARTLHEDGVVVHAYMERRNPGLAEIAQEISIGPMDDYYKLPDLTGFDYAVIGPEAALGAGFSDYLTKEGVPCVGPTQAAAMIETSKSFARKILQKKYPKANPRFSIARSMDDLRSFEKIVGIEKIVVKPDGLTGGQGVRIFGEHLSTREDLEKYVSRELWNKGIVVLEERLVGTEFTIQAFVDGKNVVTMPLVRSYERPFDNDEGPISRSMGSYSKASHGLDFVTEEDHITANEILLATVDQTKKTAASEFKGILYGQFIKTNNGLKVIEFNSRFGDPEAMNVLSILKTSFNEVCSRVIDGTLGFVDFKNQATVCVYLVPEGYPGSEVVTDSQIDVSVAATAEIYFSSVFEREKQVLTTEGRAIGVLAKADTVGQARELAYDNASRIKGNLRYRTDIAKDVE